MNSNLSKHEFILDKYKNMLNSKKDNASLSKV